MTISSDNDDSHSEISSDPKIVEYSKARDDAWIKLAELMNKELPESASQSEALDSYNELVKAVHDYAYAERRLVLHVALILAEKLEQYNLIPTHRIASKLCYNDLRECLDVEGGNRNSFVTPRWLATALPSKYRKK